MSNLSDPHTVAGAPRVFAVDDVEPAADPIWTQPLSSHAEARFVRKLFLLPEPQRQVVNVHGDFAVRHGRLPNRTAVSRVHPLIDAVHLAFSQHRPLTLTPDSIWLTIAQGFAHHISEHAEELRSRLVRHAGQRELEEKVEGISLEHFEKAIAGFSSQIREASDPVLHETLICDFSTTTPDVRTASEVVLMDCYASYFTYAMRCVCGIPKVTLAGTVEDWRRMRARVEVLATFELEWWVKRLRPILDQLIATAEGKPDVAFWQAIYKPRETYGAEMVTGWIADLFPYLGEPAARERNLPLPTPQRRPPICDSGRHRSRIFEHERTGWAMPGDEGVSTRGFHPGAKFGVASRSFPSGLSSVPIKLTFSKDPKMETQLDLVAGFLGVAQDSELSLTPVISWAVAEKAPVQPVVI